MSENGFREVGRSGNGWGENGSGENGRSEESSLKMDGVKKKLVKYDWVKMGRVLLHPARVSKNLPGNLKIFICLSFCCRSRQYHSRELARQWSEGVAGSKVFQCFHALLSHAFRTHAFLSHAFLSHVRNTGGQVGRCSVAAVG